MHPDVAPAAAVPEADTSRPPLVELRGITKRFGTVVANDGIALAIRPGEIQSVLGENGAGKTTLLSILAGMIRPDAGTIAIGGESVVFGSPRDALRHGIGTVYQHFTLVPTLSIIENVVLGADSRFLLDLAGAERRLAALLGDFDLPVSPRTPVRHLAVGQRQRVEIVKALFRGSRILLLDEPTSVLSPAEVDDLFRVLRRLRADGVGVVLVTHKLEEALALSDRVTVLRAGRKVGELGPETLNDAQHDAVRQQIVGWMFGAASTEHTRTSAGMGGGAHAAPRAILSLCDVRAMSDRDAPALHAFSLALHAGEIFGLAGVDGNGQQELAEVIAGQRRVAAGRVLLGGRELTNRGAAVAAGAGIGYVTDDRLGEGCVAAGSVAENLALKAVGRPPFARGFLLNRRAMEANARRLIAEFDVRTPAPATPVGHLSGGNIQKLLLARELARDPRVLICNKPTAGLDLKTTQFILRTLRERADAGMSILLISTELDELLAVSDRIGVMSGGRIVAVLPRAEASAATIGRLMLGGGT